MAWRAVRCRRWRVRRGRQREWQQQCRPEGWLHEGGVLGNESSVRAKIKVDVADASMGGEVVAVLLRFVMLEVLVHAGTRVATGRDEALDL